MVRKTVWENVCVPPEEIGTIDGGLSCVPTAVIISPSPWRKSVSTLATRCSKLSTSPPRCTIRISWWVAARARPWRVSSMRVHMCFTGAPPWR